MYKTTTFLFIILLLSLTSYSQTTVSGRVVEKGTGEALSFATVSIKESNQGVVANVDGFFSLINVDVINLVLIVQFVGYQTREIEVEDSNNLIIELEEITNELSEVVITANGYKTFDASKGISATTLSTKQISVLPSIGEPDIFRSLQMLPVVSSTSESSSGLFIRGGTPDQNLTLLDGMTVYKVDHFFGFFSAFNANAIKDVRLYRGAFPARYGGRMSGVVELTGKTGSFEKVQGGVNVSLLSVSGFFELPISNKLSLLVAGRRSYSEVIKGGLFKDLIGNLTSDESLNNTALEDATRISTDPDFYFYDLNTKLSYRPSDKDILTVSTYSGKDYLDESQRTFDDVTADVFVEYDLAEQTDWGNQGASAKWSRQWGPKIYTNLLLAGTEYFSNYDRKENLLIARQDSVVFDRGRSTLEDNSVIDLSIRADLEWQMSLDAKAEFGFSHTNNQIEYSNTRNDTTTLLDRSQEASYTSIYASQEGKIGDKFVINAGIRATHYDFSDEILLAID